ncbi:MAG: hypothetical protein WC777_05490 [Candidatus Gracilibacteria bacterium]|jgi:hypothetical protein
MAEDRLDEPKYSDDMLVSDDRFTATLATDVAIVERGGVRTTTTGEINDPAIEARAAQLMQDPAELMRAIQHLVGMTSSETEEEQG